MADDKNFKALIAEQKKTTTALNKLAGIEEQSSDKKDRSAAQQAADDKMRGKRNEKHQIKIEKQGKTEDGTGTPPPAAGEEDKKDRMKSLANAIGKPLGKFGKSIGGAIKSLGSFFKDKFGGGVKTLGNLLKFGVAGLALMALSKFFKSETWAEWKDKLVPILVDAFHMVTDAIKWTGRTIMDGINAFRVLFGGLFDKDGKFVGISAAFTHLKENANLIGPALAGLGVGFLGISTLIGGPKLAGKLGIGAVKLAIKGIVGTVTGLGTAFTAIGGSLTAIGGVMGVSAAAAAGTIVAVVAGIVSIGVGLYKGIQAFRDKFKETGDIFESAKVGFATFLGEAIGFIPNLILDLTGYVAGLFGFDSFKAKIQNIDVAKFFTDAFLDLFDKISFWIRALYLKIKPVLDKIGNFFQPAVDILQNIAGFIIKLLAPFKVVIDKVKKIFKKIGGAIGGLFTTTDEERREKIAEQRANIVLMKDQDKKLGKDANKNAIGRAEERIAKLQGEMGPEIEKAQSPKIEDLPKPSTDAPDVNALLPGMGAAAPMMAETTTVISAPVSNTTNMSSSTNISKTIVEPDAYFLRQSGWAI